MYFHVFSHLPRLDRPHDLPTLLAPPRTGPDRLRRPHRGGDSGGLRRRSRRNKAGIHQVLLEGNSVSRPLACLFVCLFLFVLGCFGWLVLFAGLAVARKVRDGEGELKSQVSGA